MVVSPSTTGIGTYMRPIHGVSVITGREQLIQNAHRQSKSHHEARATRAYRVSASGPVAHTFLFPGCTQPTPYEAPRPCTISDITFKTKL
ncbi:unnamed protein product [Toxocara canis]|uniref:Uncharacterized protein n=1 Tax=Toxocara canis TaxID=6265 RepID=A0A183VEV5_TOXCA|nr:unnamed protein product [Toxocara canis]